jgi:hypothetical protein
MQTRDLGTIRLVTQHYRELQGLHLALAGVMFVIASGVFLAGLPQEDVVGSMIGLSGCVVYAFAGEYLKHYYATRYGVIEGGRPSWVVVGCLVSGLLLALAADWTPAPRSLVFLPYGLMHVWIVVRDFPHRGHHLAGAAASAAAFMVVGFSAAANALPLLQAFCLQGSGWVIVGLLDIGCSPCCVLAVSKRRSRRKPSWTSRRLRTPASGPEPRILRARWRGPHERLDP